MAKNLHFITAFKRSFSVSVLGMGFGIPILNFICFFFSYRDLKGHGMSTWDHKIGTVILYGKVSMSRLCIACCFPVGMLAAGIYHLNKKLLIVAYGHFKQFFYYSICIFLYITVSVFLLTKCS